jgi:uncharacterized protein YdiU (UPF0061 family)
LHACDTWHQYSLGYQPAYQKKDAILSHREELLSHFISKLVIQNGFYNINIVALAYKSAYSNTASRQKLYLIMRSDKIMGEVAKNLKDALHDNEMDVNWVMQQLKDMGEKDYDKDPERRLEVVKLAAKMNQIPVYDEQLPPPPKELTSEVEEAEVEVIEEDLRKVG